MKSSFGRLSLAQQFLLVSFPILLAGTLVIGWWIGLQVQDSVVHRIGGVTALYVDSFVAPHVQTLANSDDLTVADRAELARLLADTPLGKKIISLKIWRPDGRVLFSSDGQGVGQNFSIEEGLEDALKGNIVSEVSERSEAERVGHGAPMARLIETYTPIHADRQGRVIAAAEFYQNTDEVDHEAGIVQRRSWALVAGTMLAMYLLLFVVVRGGSRTIVRQQRELTDKIAQLMSLNDQNTQLHERVRRAAARTTALNENFLQRVSADIHDGPGQDLGFALMQLRSIEACTKERPKQTCVAENLEPVRHAVQSALSDLRTISADLQVPDVAQLGLGDVAARVARDYESKTGAKVTLETVISNVQASTRVKLTLYRLLQESLANTFHHAQCKNPHVRLEGDACTLKIEVTDDGPGFDAHAALKKGRLGLAGMRERVEILGGTFEIESGRGRGTKVRATLPLTSRETADA